MDRSVREPFHQLVDLIVDALDRVLDEYRGRVRHPLLLADHAEDLIGSKEDIGELVQHPLGRGEVYSDRRVDLGVGFVIHSTQE